MTEYNSIQKTTVNQINVAIFCNRMAVLYLSVAAKTIDDEYSTMAIFKDAHIISHDADSVYLLLYYRPQAITRSTNRVSQYTIILTIL